MAGCCAAAVNPGSDTVPACEATVVVKKTAAAMAYRIFSPPPVLGPAELGFQGLLHELAHRFWLAVAQRQANYPEPFSGSLYMAATTMTR